MYEYFPLYNISFSSINSTIKICTVTEEHGQGPIALYHASGLCKFVLYKLLFGQNGHPVGGSSGCGLCPWSSLRKVGAYVHSTTYI